MRIAIALENISVAFQQSTGQAQALYYALRDLSLTISQGEFIGLVGANGSGKSTLGQVLAGILPLSRGHMDRNGRLAMVFQHPDAQVIGETVFEDLCFGLENRAISPDEMPQRVSAALRQVGLDVRPDRAINTLSGGQRQLLCIAAALVMEPDILLFDEATAMLNGPARLRMMDVAKSLHGRGTTVIWITQRLEELTDVQRVLALTSGRLTFDGTPRAFFYGEVQPPLPAQTPCAIMGWEPPFAIQTAFALQAQGIDLGVLPLTLQDVANQVAAR